MQKDVKMAQKLPKMSQMPTIGHYLTVFNLKKGIKFLDETNRLACFDPIWVPYSETNSKYF